MFLKILTPEEIALVSRDLSRKSKRSLSTKLNEVIFQTVTGTGLRVSELAGLNLADFTLVGSRPCIRVRKEIAKGKKARIIPLWWSSRCLESIQGWARHRLEEGAGPQDPFLVTLFTGLRPTEFGEPMGGPRRMTRDRLAARWKSAISCLPPERVKQLSIHAGRHTFCSYALHAGRSLAEVRDAAGHANISMTSHYLHTLDSGNVPDLYR